MSGVFGILDSRRHERSGALLAQMGSSMAHRDWYVVETHTDPAPGVHLGRIGIGIFNPEQQPLRSRDGNILVFFTGEPYKSEALRRGVTAEASDPTCRCDADLVLGLYQKEREKFIHSLEGAFQLVIWDDTRQQAIIANDRFGLYPLYYAHYAGRLLFAPEVKGILCDSDFRRDLDPSAFVEYIRFQHLLGDKTFHRGILLLPNASILRYSPRTDQVELKSYWDFSRIPALPNNLCLNEAAEEAGRLLAASVRERSQGEKQRLGIYLTGGLDSRVILGFSCGGARKLTSITFGAGDSRDAVYARRLAALGGTEHHFFEYKDGNWVKEFVDFHLTLTEGFHSWIHAHGVSVLPEVRGLIDVNLTGYGGSEINWEDPQLYHARDDSTFCTRLFALLLTATTWPCLTETEAGALFSPAIEGRTRGIAFTSLADECSRLGYLPYERRALYLSFNTDRRFYQYHTVFSRSHVEQRFPFFDYQYYDFLQGIPPEMRFGRRLRRALVTKMMPRLAKVPYDKDDLPVTSNDLALASARVMQKLRSRFNRHVAEIFPRYKTLHSDYESWLRQELRDWGHEIFLGDRILQRKTYDPASLESLWARLQSAIESNIIGKIAPIMTYEMLLRRFYD